MADRFEAVVIGTGFGGAINACRLSKRWPGQVLVLERGKRYPMGSFPRKPHEFATNFFNVPDERSRRPKNVPKKQLHGMFDIRNFDHMDTVVCAGLGGGSLIYANVFLEPPDEVFDERWVSAIKKDKLRRYYDVAKGVLGSRPIPDYDKETGAYQPTPDSDPRRRIIRTELFKTFASEVGRDSKLVDLNVFFGNDFSNPTPIGVQEKNRYGAVQTSCVYCAECDAGCNTHSKNTTDLNYLFVAENVHEARVETEVLAERIAPVDANGNEDPSANGEHGYRVTYRDLTKNEKVEVLTKRVVVSAGTLGSTEILLRCRDVYKTLPKISRQLGHQYSGNGDFLSFVVETDRPADPNYGPVITQRTDYNLFSDWKSDIAFIMEDASYPDFLAWYIEGAKPKFFMFDQLLKVVRNFWTRFLQCRSMSNVGSALSTLLSNDLSYRTAVLLCMGHDKSDGTMTLDRNGRLDIDWPYENSIDLYNAILGAGEKFKEVFNAKAFIPLPTWLWPMRKNVSVHSLGGCHLSETPEKGVTSSEPGPPGRTFGHVFGYENLYVADGALLPTAVGANPIATISAVSEMVAEGITEIKPDDTLK